MSTINETATNSVAALVKLARNIESLRQEMQNQRRIFEQERVEAGRRYMFLLEKYVQLAEQARSIPSVASMVPSNPVSVMQMFDEVPLDSDLGYKQDELDLGGEYQEFDLRKVMDSHD